MDTLSLRVIASGDTVSIEGDSVIAYTLSSPMQERVVRY